MTLLQVEDLVKRYGALAATDHVNFSVERGEVHALIGPNGAGKTTLIHLISGALPSDAGRVQFDGRDVTRVGMAGRVAAGLARSHQITSVFAQMSVLDNLRLAVMARQAGGWWRAAQHDQLAREQAEALLQRIGLTPRAEQAAGQLAHGEQRQLELGLALATAPRLLLLDEPMA
ncbi:MAG TPA: ATP-binding cassette domain-containing protein, partial [Burkholderiaceae bacterium]